MFQDQGLLPAPEGLPEAAYDLWIGVALTLFIVDRVWYMFKTRWGNGDGKTGAILAPFASMEKKLDVVHRALLGDEVNHDGVVEMQKQLLASQRDTRSAVDILSTRVDRLEERISHLEARRAS